MSWKDDEARLLIALYDGEPLNLAVAKNKISPIRVNYLKKKWSAEKWIDNNGSITRRAPSRERLVGTLPEDISPQVEAHPGEEPFPLPQE